MYYGARYYSPELKRFTSPDKVASFSPQSILKDPQSLNIYTYARNNPVKYVDPTGDIPLLGLLLLEPYVVSAVVTTGVFLSRAGPAILRGAQVTGRFVRSGVVKYGNKAKRVVGKAWSNVSDKANFVAKKVSRNKLSIGIGTAASGATTLGIDYMDDGEINAGAKRYATSLAFGVGTSYATIGVGVWGTGLVSGTGSMSENWINNEFNPTEDITAAGASIFGRTIGGLAKNAGVRESLIQALESALETLSNLLAKRLTQ